MGLPNACRRSPDGTSLQHTNKDMVMLIPEFSWSCSFLTTKLLDFPNKHAHLLTASKGCFAHAQEEVCTHWVHLLPHCLCPAFAMSVVFHRASCCGPSLSVSGYLVLFRLHSAAAVTECSYRKRKRNLGPSCVPPVT